jgi:hypothetical protein
MILAILALIGVSLIGSYVLNNPDIVFGRDAAEVSGKTAGPDVTNLIDGVTVTFDPPSRHFSQGRIFTACSSGYHRSTSLRRNKEIGVSYEATTCEPDASSKVTAQ